MLRYVVAALCGITLTGSVYKAGWDSCEPYGQQNECEECVAAANATPLAATDKAAVAGKAVDVKNTKCLVTKQDSMEDTPVTVEFKGKLYHLCCKDCVEDFNKDPEKYVKAFDADPAAFGVK